jgi:CheY-like chemotaxis protein
MAPTEHIVASFDRDLEAIQANIMRMGGLVEEAIAKSAKALDARDPDLARSVREGDAAIDALDEQINEEAARIIAQRQPIASDLRTVLSVFRISSNLERIGDYAKNIAKRSEAIMDHPPVNGTGASLRRMARQVELMLKDVLDAYIQRDAGPGARRARPRYRGRPDVFGPVPRIPDLHDGRPAQHHDLHAPAFHGQEHRAHGRPRHLHRRTGDLHGHRRHPRRGPAQAGASAGRTDRRADRGGDGTMAGEPLVLVVEDEPAQREVLAYNIRAEGYEVVTAEAGDEALVVVRETPPDVIILDWMLPNVSGIEVCRQLKMSGDTARIPVIMLSARSEETDKVRGLETGADDYIVKPYSVAELLARVRTQLRRTARPRSANGWNSRTSSSIWPSTASTATA